MNKETHYTIKAKKKMKGRKFSKSHKEKLAKKKRGIFGKKANAYGHKLSKISKEKIAKKKRGKRVSIATEFKKGDKRITGPNNPKWKGGICQKENRRTHENTKWSRAVLKRDNYICQICGYQKSKKKDLVAHHIFSYKLFPKSRFFISNGITLCRMCHFKVHNSNKL